MGWPPNTPYDYAEARRTQVADATLQKWNFKMKFQYDSPPQIPFLRG